MARLTSVMVLGLSLFLGACEASKPPVRVGVLHSQSGTMAKVESPLIDAVLLAIEEINTSGGINGRVIEPIIFNSNSSSKLATEGVKTLIDKKKVDVIFGCGTSACRKAVKPIVEERQSLLFYPVQHEGLEQSKNIIYTGATPNQQIIPAIKWSFDHLGKHFYLIGSDYVFPRTANQIIRKQSAILGSEIVGEDYVLLGHEKFDEIVQKIIASKASVIINTLNGDSNKHFFDALMRADLKAETMPVMSFSIGEPMVTQAMTGHYVSWNYFQSIDTKRNHAFIKKIKAKFGKDRLVSDPMEASYFGVHIWALAAQKASSTRPLDVSRMVKNTSYPAPGGIAHVDMETNHTWRVGRIGRINSNGQFDQVWKSDFIQRPVPFPPFIARYKWQNILDNLQKGWNSGWSASES